jgi:hypothetical protein
VNVLHRYDWTDLGYTGLVTRLDSGIASWRVVEVQETSVNGGPFALYPVHDQVESPDPATWDDVDFVVEVDVKADGCANWHWDPNCATHTCDGVKGAQKLGYLVNRVMHTTADILQPNWIRSSS